MPVLEVVVTSLADVRAAAVGGADRLELAGCHTALGALSPSFGLMAMARRVAPDVPIFAVTRPRFGAFVYEETELRQMLADIGAARKAGLDGLFLGAVTPEGTLDVTALQRLFDAAGGLRVCINMAFDRCRDPEGSLDWLVRDGRVERILTSGGAKSALEGAPRIATLLRQARGRIQVMPGTGIDATTLPPLLRAIPAIDQVHVSAGARASSEPFAAVDVSAVARLRGILACAAA